VPRKVMLNVGPANSTPVVQPECTDAVYSESSTVCLIHCAACMQWLLPPLMLAGRWCTCPQLPLTWRWEKWRLQPVSA